uniref:Response regulator n=1 Tax=candidate division WOR-3 bacterium TaxID=2052148 RepID=A0A7C4YEQ9_UNCW3
MAKRILLVEDEEDILSLYKDVLESEGYIVECARTGIEGVEKFKHSEFDLVILDIRMPQMDGIEVLGRILNEKKDTKIIINSAYGSYKDNFLTWGADAYLIKSSSTETLINKVKELIG